MVFSSIQLHHHPFLPVTASNLVCCGGHQRWYSSQERVLRGCAPVAAANLTAYLGLYHPGCRALYPYDTLDQASFLKHMDALYDFVRPGVFGAYRPSRVAQRILSFGSSREVRLHFQLIHAKKSSAAVLQFIQESLLVDLPVMALVLHFPIFSNSAFGWHWVTITGLLEKEGLAVLQLSNHGKEEFIPFEEFYHLQHRWPSFGGAYLRIEGERALYE